MNNYKRFFLKFYTTLKLIIFFFFFWKYGYVDIARQSGACEAEVSCGSHDISPPSSLKKKEIGIIFRIVLPSS